MEPVFVEGWDSVKGMAASFEMDANDLDGIEVLLASYGSCGYEGGAWVLFRKGDKLFEVSGSHCSCNGLEGQWVPEETTIPALEHRLREGLLGKDSDNPFGPQLAVVLEKLRTQVR